MRVTFILALISVSPHLSRCIWTGDQKEEKERENEKRFQSQSQSVHRFFVRGTYQLRRHRKKIKSEER